jgi:hypothetical protein
MQARLTELETESTSVSADEAQDPAVAAEAAPPTEVTSEASKEPTSPTQTVAEEKPDDEESEEAEEDTADEAKDVTTALTELSNAAATTKSKPVVEDTPANETPAPPVDEPEKTDARPTLEPRGRKAATKDIEPKVVVVPRTNEKESKEALVKVKDNPTAQVQSDQPIRTRKTDDIGQWEYNKFYKSITKDKTGPETKTHIIAEGEVTFVPPLRSQQPAY